MKKTPSYPKITTKTNITFTQTQTQNININSPKNLPFSPNSLSTKKLFKSASENINTFANKLNREREKSNNLTPKHVNGNDKSAYKIPNHKISKTTKELPSKKPVSSGYLKSSKNYDSQLTVQQEEPIK